MPSGPGGGGRGWGGWGGASCAQGLGVEHLMSSGPGREGAGVYALRAQVEGEGLSPDPGVSGRATEAGRDRTLVPKAAKCP